MDHRIALVDDDHCIRHFLTEFLSLKGFTVDCFSSAEDALVKLQSGIYTLAVFDVVLPGISGLEACATLRKEKNTETLPVILMSAINRSREQIREARDIYGASVYLLKPFSLDTLHQHILQLIDGEAPTQAPPLQKPPRIEGDLATTAFPKLLHDLYALQLTGLLHINHADRKKAIYFKSGYPIFVRSNLVRECLGNVLCSKNLISERECEESLRTVRETGKLQGSVLVEMGLLKDEQLSEVLRVQATEKLLEIFTWQEGTFHFTPAVNFKKTVTQIDLSPANIIIQGIRNSYNEAKVDQLLKPHLKSYPALSENPHFRFQDVELIQREAKILAECNGRATCEHILDRYPLSRFENKRLLASLFLINLIEAHKEQLALSERTSLFSSSPEEEKISQEFINTYNQMMKKNFFELFGAKTDATDEEIRRCYVDLAKTYHPDRLQQAQLSTDLKQKANALFQRISEAYETLSNKKKRHHYLAQLQGKTKKTENDKAADLLAAENSYQRGVVYLNKNNFDSALKELKKAVDICAEEPEYLCYLAMAKFKAAKGNTSMINSAKELIQKSIRLNSNLDKAHLFHGYMLKEAGRLQEAAKRFERAIQCNPNCTEALRELRLINMRNPSDKGASVLGKLFKK
jgi:CheY-like chemotaxis protein